jgi:hypothetical protein
LEVVDRLRSVSQGEESDLKILQLYRIKSMILMCEVASVMMVVLPLRGRLPALAVPGCLIALLYVIAILALPVGVALQVRCVLQLALLLGDSVSEISRQLFARYVFLCSLAVVVGFNVGTAAGQLNMALLGFVLFGAGIAGAISVSILLPWKGDIPLLSWPFMLLGMGYLGHRMLQSPSIARVHVLTLYLLIPIVLAASFLVGALWLRWLIRPFRLRDLFSPILPARLRFLLCCLARISHQKGVEGRTFWYKWLSESHLGTREEAALNARLYFAAV